MIKRPMKAPTDPLKDDELRHLNFPLVGSPKLDGFRCVIDTVAHTSSMKPFANRRLQEELSRPDYHYLDGELVIGSPYKEHNEDDVFNRTSGPIRRFDGDPDFCFFVFDRPIQGRYNERWLDTIKPDHPRIVVLEQRLLRTPEDVIAYETEMVDLGYEGAMIRSLDGFYKEGRCTFREQNIFKRKPFAECEATIVGYEEAMENTNEQEENELGLMKRSHRAEGLVPKGTLGSCILKSPLWSSTFNARLGKGYTAADGLNLWYARSSYLGATVTVKYQKYGSIDRPRMPSIIKIRSSWDLTQD